MNPTLAGMAEAAKVEREKWTVTQESHDTYQTIAGSGSGRYGKHAVSGCTLKTVRECLVWIEAQGQRAALEWLASVFPHNAVTDAAEAMFGRPGQNEIDLAVEGINAALRAITTQDQP